MEERQPPQEKAIGLRLAQFSIDHPVTILMVFASFMVLGAVSISANPGGAHAGHQLPICRCVCALSELDSRASAGGDSEASRRSA